MDWLLARLGVDAQAPIPRALSLIALVMIVGGIGVVIMALGQSGAGVVRFLLIGLLAAIAAATGGGLVGLIFGLPGSGTPAASHGGSGAAETNAAATADWFADNSALGQISTWLTGAIIALSLSNFDSWTHRFDRAAQVVSREMIGAPGDDAVALSSAVARAGATLAASRAALATVDAAAKAALAASAQPPSSVGKTPPASAAGAAARPGVPAPDAAAAAKAKTATSSAAAKARAAAVQKVTSAQAELDAALAAQRNGDSIALGALLLGGYGLLGFLGGYLWTRRYLPAELARARKEQRDVQRDDAQAAATAAAALAANNVQTRPSKSRSTFAAASRQAAAADASRKAAAAGNNEGVVALLTSEVVQPGETRGDPWKGRFGGSPQSANLELSATVRPNPRDPETFAVDLRINARDPAAAADLTGTRVRVYLHPTFPDPIRIVTFGSDGEIALPLLAYGAFTVGVQRLDTDERLELDLATLPDAPPLFRAR